MNISENPKKFEKDPDCPICNNAYFAIDESVLVCENHLDEWHVCVCVICGKPNYRNVPLKVCRKCEKEDIKNSVPGVLGFSKDYRAALRGYGLEGWS